MEKSRKMCRNFTVNMTFDYMSMKLFLISSNTLSAHAIDLLPMPLIHPNTASVKQLSPLKSPPERRTVSNSTHPTLHQSFSKCGSLGICLFKAEV